MTGFARVRKTVPQGEIVLSLKSVNHRGLDLHFHLPHELDPIENEIRTAIRAGVARGHVQIHVSFTRAVSEVTTPLNRNLMAAYIAAFREAAALYGVGGAMPDLNSALRISGMFGTADEEDLGEDVGKA